MFTHDLKMMDKMRGVIHRNIRQLILRAFNLTCSLILALYITSAHRQDPVIVKTVTESLTNCIEYDVDLTVSGHSVMGADVPVEVILVIDRSSSMGYNIPGDPNELIVHKVNVPRRSTSLIDVRIF